MFETINKKYIHYVAIISLWKGTCPFIWTKLSALRAKFGWSWPSGSGEDF